MKILKPKTFFAILNTSLIFSLGQQAFCFEGNFTERGTKRPSDNDHPLHFQPFKKTKMDPNFRVPTTGPLTIRSWNIQKINPQKAKNFGPEIGQILFGREERFVSSILENKRDPQEVIRSLSAEAPRGTEFRYISMGGNSYTRENLIVASRGVEEMELTNVDLSKHYTQLQKQEKTHKLIHPSLNKSKTQSGGRNIAGTPSSFPNFESLRSPVSLSFRNERQQSQVFLSHLPGPKVTNKNPQLINVYNQSCYDHFLRTPTPSTFLGMMGDYNLHNHKNVINKTPTYLLPTTPTTLNKKGQPSSSTYDRTFSTLSQTVKTSDQKVSFPSHCGVSDHGAISVTVQKTGRRNSIAGPQEFYSSKNISSQPIPSSIQKGKKFNKKKGG